MPDHLVSLPTARSAPVAVRLTGCLPSFTERNTNIMNYAGVSTFNPATLTPIARRSGLAAAASAYDLGLSISVLRS